VNDSRIRVRPAEPGDAGAIAEIYNQGIRARIATFETEERSAEERRAWLAAHDERHPVLVATVAGPDGAERVAGWASTDRYRSRACYDGVAEFSIYVHEAFRGRGLGAALLGALIDAAGQAGLWKLVSRIFPENRASLALCDRHGFREVGTYEKHAKLDGAWRDVVIVERLIPANLR
jgi:phosphinothricin acetyltransferase